MENINDNHVHNAINSNIVIADINSLNNSSNKNKNGSINDNIELMVSF